MVGHSTTLYANFGAATNQKKKRMLYKYIIILRHCRHRLYTGYAIKLRTSDIIQ